MYSFKTILGLCFAFAVVFIMQFVKGAESSVVDPPKAISQYQNDVNALFEKGKKLAKEVSAGKVMAYDDPKKAKQLCDIVEAIGKLRAKKAVSFLTEIIRFNKPGLPPVRPPAFEDFPAAAALVSIGVPSLPSLQKLLESEQTWQLSTDAIRQILGNRLAILSFQDKEGSLKDLSAKTRKRSLDFINRFSKVEKKKVAN